MRDTERNEMRPWHGYPKQGSQQTSKRNSFVSNSSTHIHPLPHTLYLQQQLQVLARNVIGERDRLVEIARGDREAVAFDGGARGGRRRQRVQLQRELGLDARNDGVGRVGGRVAANHNQHGNGLSVVLGLVCVCARARKGHSATDIPTMGQWQKGGEIRTSNAAYSIKQMHTRKTQ